MIQYKEKSFLQEWGDCTLSFLSYDNLYFHFGGSISDFKTISVSIGGDIESIKNIFIVNGGGFNLRDLFNKHKFNKISVFYGAVLVAKFEDGEW